MYPDMNLATTHVLREERLREAEHQRLVASVREPHQWRKRVGTSLIHLGRVLAEERVEQRTRSTARIA
jgi:Na+/phosphate symporter